MWCAQVAFWFPFELTLPAGGYPILRGGRRAMLAVEFSARCWRTTVVVPAADRPPDDHRDITENRAVFAGHEIPVRKVTVSSARKFLEQIDENVGLSFVTVLFEKDGDCPEPMALDANAQERLVDEAIDFVRYFASVYRFISWQTDVFAPSRHDSPVVRIDIARNYTFADMSVGGEFTRVSRQFLMPADPRSGLGKARLSEDQIRELIADFVPATGCTSPMSSVWRRGSSVLRTEPFVSRSLSPIQHSRLGCSGECWRNSAAVASRTIRQVQLTR